MSSFQDAEHFILGFAVKASGPVLALLGNQHPSVELGSDPGLAFTTEEKVSPERGLANGYFGKEP